MLHSDWLQTSILLISIIIYYACELLCSVWLSTCVMTLYVRYRMLYMYVYAHLCTCNICSLTQWKFLLQFYLKVSSSICCCSLFFYDFWVFFFVFLVSITADPSWWWVQHNDSSEDYWLIFSLRYSTWVPFYLR